MDQRVRTLAEAAILDAVRDAGMMLGDVEAVYAANAIAGMIDGQEMIRGQVALQSIGIHDVPVVNVENACASGSSAVHLAWTAVGAGLYDVALAYGVEKMFHPDKRLTIRAIATALDVEEPVDPDSKSPFMDSYAQRVRRYMDACDATMDDFAHVVQKARQNARYNSRAQFRTEIAVQEALEAPLIAWPLTRVMCSPVSDGAAAILLVAAERLPAPPDRPRILVRASALRSTSGPDSPGNAVQRAAAAAYQAAGMGPTDLDVLEVHDATAPGEIMRYDWLGLSAPGEGAKLIRDKSTSLGGATPVNVGGGLLARGHPIAATGCAQLVELSEQLRGTTHPALQVPGARIALSENSGGTLSGETAASCVHIIERVDRS
jgi:acetyl-CoA acetyltransferase